MATRVELDDRRERVILRIALGALSVLVVLWAVTILGRPEIFREHDDLIWQNLFGETFHSQQMAHMRTPCDAYRTSGHPRAALLAALVAVRDAELALAEAKADDIKSLAHCASAASRHLLQTNPSSSIGWLLLAWTERLSGADPETTSRDLARSVALAPRELWMAMKRMPLMRVELLRGNLALARGEYRVLAEGERFDLAASLLADCVTLEPFCEMDWNAGLDARTVKLVWDERIRRGE